MATNTLRSFGPPSKLGSQRDGRPAQVVDVTLRPRFVFSYALRADVTPPTMEQAGSVFPDLVEATEMRLSSKMAASCLG